MKRAFFALAILALVACSSSGTGSAGDAGAGASGGSGGSGASGGGGASGGSGGNGATSGTGGVAGGGPFACGADTCGSAQICIHPCCGGALPPCVPMEDGGVCPAGTHAGCSNGSGMNCTDPAACCEPDPCTPPPPYCSDTPESGCMMQGQDCYLACA